MTNFMRVTVAGLALATLFAACAPSQSRPVSHPKTTASANPLTQDLGLQGMASTFSQNDPKHPSWLLWKLAMKQVVGNLAESSNTVTGHGITATLYTNGKADGVMTAPKAVGYFHTEEIVASGGVVYRSLSYAGRVLRADTVTWNAKTKTGLAQGNVHYHDTSGRNGQMPYLYFNSGLKSFSSSPLH